MLSSLSKNDLYRGLVRVLWFFLIISLPITSLPLIARFTGSLVAPLSAIPLAVLLLVWLIPFLIERGKFPIEILPFLYFVLIALVITSLSFFLGGYYSRGRDFFDQSFRAFITVGIGLAFYLLFSVYPQTEGRIRQTLLFINIMGVILIPLTMFEVLLLRKYTVVQNFPGWVLSIRNALAVQSPNTDFTTRVFGFAYEPSWFVRLFDLILFPVWLAAVFQRKSLLKWRLWVFQIEDLLMVLGLVVFAFSSPRIGLLAFLASLAFLTIQLLSRLVQRCTTWYITRRKRPLKNTLWVKILIGVILTVILLGLAAGALVGYITIASSWDNRFQLMLREPIREQLDIFPLSTERIIYFARDLAFFERVIFWISGLDIFNDFPFGVGLGNAGFYFLDHMHGAGFESYELRYLAYRANYLANTKNMWTRLLAETGFIGFAAFLVWLYIQWRSAGVMRKSKSEVLQILGLAGQLFLLAYLFESFSMDSFAMPYQWVMMGLIAAGGLLARKEQKAKDRPAQLA